MDTIDKPAPAIWNIILVSGILLILWSLYSLVKAYNEVQVRTSLDVYPCEASIIDMPSDTRIAYCIHSRHYKIYGPGYYAGGTTHLNEVMAGEFKLRRQEQTLFVNDQPFQIGERYDVVRQNPSFNPWLKFTTHFVIENSGLYSPARNALYVTGEVKEGWQVNPLGATILVSGIGLVVLGNWATKRKKIARGQYVMEPSVPRNLWAREIAVGFFGWVLFNSVYISLLFLLYWIQGLAVNLFLVWPPTIIAILVLYGMKRFSICKGVVLAVVINSGIWMVILPVMNVSFFEALSLCGIPLPLGLLIIF